MKEPQENEIIDLVDENHYEMLKKIRFKANNFLNCQTVDCKGTYIRHDENNFFYCELCD